MIIDSLIICKNTNAAMLKCINQLVQSGVYIECVSVKGVQLPHPKDDVEWDKNMIELLHYIIKNLYNMSISNITENLHKVSISWHDLIQLFNSVEDIDSFEDYIIPALQESQNILNKMMTREFHMYYLRDNCVTKFINNIIRNYKKPFIVTLYALQEFGVDTYVNYVKRVNQRTSLIHLDVYSKIISHRPPPTNDLEISFINKLIEKNVKISATSNLVQKIFAREDDISRYGVNGKMLLKYVEHKPNELIALKREKFQPEDICLYDSAIVRALL